MRKTKRHKITTILRFAKRVGLPLETVMDMMYKKRAIVAPILVFGRDGLPRIDETEFHKEFGASRVKVQRVRRSITSGAA